MKREGEGQNGEDKWEVVAGAPASGQYLTLSISTQTIDFPLYHSYVSERLHET